MDPPISPMRTIPEAEGRQSVCIGGPHSRDGPSVVGSSSKKLSASQVLVPGNGSPPASGRLVQFQQARATTAWRFTESKDE